MKELEEIYEQIEQDYDCCFEATDYRYSINGWIIVLYGHEYGMQIEYNENKNEIEIIIESVNGLNEKFKSFWKVYKKYYGDEGFYDYDCWQYYINRKYYNGAFSTPPVNHIRIVQKLFKKYFE